MALIRLTGKYAVGAHAFAIVDDDMFEFLNQWKWKAKPNGKQNNVYAVRNSYDRKHVTIRMHRVVLGMDASNPLEVDHDNHNSLDNRRANLIPATRSENALNARPVTQIGACKHCSAPMERVISSCARGNSMACAGCRKALRDSKTKARREAKNAPKQGSLASHMLTESLGSLSELASRREQ